MMLQRHQPQTRETGLWASKLYLSCRGDVCSFSLNFRAGHIPQGKHALLLQHLQIPVCQQRTLLVGLKWQLQFPGSVAGWRAASCPEHHVCWYSALGVVGQLDVDLLLGGCWLNGLRGAGLGCGWLVMLLPDAANLQYEATG